MDIRSALDTGTLLLLVLASFSRQCQADVLSDISSGLSAATDAVSQATNTAASAVESAADTATTAVTEATTTAANAVEHADDEVVKQTHNFVSDTDNLTAVLGDELAKYINFTVFNGQRHPMVFWPGFGTSLLHVEVADGTVQNCPASGAFTAAFGQPTLIEGFPEACIYPYLQMHYDPTSGKFANAPGVTTSISDFGGQFCAPIPYEPLFLIAEAIGYTSGRDLFVACYDWRSTPYQDVGADGPHLQRAQQLVETAYSNAGGLPVYLIGHSNGPIYALALLRAMTPEWRAKFVAGFITYAGNWVGQGNAYQQLLSGASLFDNRVLPSSAPAYESWPSTYMSAASPAYYSDTEVVIRTINATGSLPPRDYTPAEALELFADAGLAQAQVLGPLLLGNSSANTTPPDTHFYGFIGTGVETAVGNTYTTAAQGQAPLANAAILSADGGDGNQENTDNEAVLHWQLLQDPCYHFELNREEGAEHLTLPFKPGVIKRTVEILFTPPAPCGGVAPSPAAVGILLRPGASQPASSLAGKR